MRNLVATRSLTYATRRLKAGDYFTARSDKDARILVAIRKARSAPAREPGSVVESDLAALRSEYEAAIGKRPFMGWDAEKLREKLAEFEASKD